MKIKNIINVKQYSKNIVLTKKTVGWLIDNTFVKVFDPIKFSGYQREIHDSHCAKIVEYINKNEFYFPNIITCAIDDKDNIDDGKYEIVDGQHRIGAFKKIKEINKNKYNEIKNYELPILLLVDHKEIEKIDTFITINKTQKRVDTSLALILKNKIINKDSIENDQLKLNIKSEYIAVELAKEYLSDSHNNLNNIWSKRISLNKTPTKNSFEFISLQSFVKSLKPVIIKFFEKKILSNEWNRETIKDIVKEMYDIHSYIWQIVEKKWSLLFDGADINRSILQGPIGNSSINRIIIDILNNNKIENVIDLYDEFKIIINNSAISWKQWIPGEFLSKFSSESGFRIVANEIKKSK